MTSLKMMSMRLGFALLLGGTALGGAAAAQFSAPGFREAPSAALTRHLRTIADQPRNVAALTGAGRAALELGDAQAALTFFARAEEIAPRDGRIKAGMGAAFVQSEQVHAALKFFADAVALGVPVAEFSGDRGLAYDLMGNSALAQADYMLSLQRLENPEVRRRLALSLAISGNRDKALATIADQLRMRDRAAWRTRAFILALTGAPDEATRAVQSVMPAQAQQMRPFFAALPALKPAERAMAVHFGHFPLDGRLRQVAAATQYASAAPATTTAATAAQPRKRAAEPVSTAPRRRPGTEAKPKQEERRASTLAERYASMSRPIQRPRAETKPDAIALSRGTRTGSPPPATRRAEARPVQQQAPVQQQGPAQQEAARPQTPAATAQTVSAAATVPTKPPAAATASRPQQPTSVPAPGFDLRALGGIAAATPPPAAAPATAGVQIAGTGQSTAVTPPASAAPNTAGTQIAGTAPSAAVTPPPAAAPGIRIAELAPSTAATPPAVQPAARSPATSPPPAAQPAPTAAQPVTASAQPPAAAATRPTALASLAETLSALNDQPAAAPAPKKPAYGPKIETPPAAKAEPKKGETAAAKKPEAKKIESKKAEAKKAEPKEPARHWVQIAGGANVAAMNREFLRLKGKAPKLLSSRTPWTTPLRATNRLLVGPFKSSAEAQDFVNELAKLDLPAFSWTSPAGQEIVKLAGK